MNEILRIENIKGRAGVYTKNDIATMLRSKMTRKTALKHIKELIDVWDFLEYPNEKYPTRVLKVNIFNIEVKKQEYLLKTQKVNPLSFFSKAQQENIFNIVHILAKDLPNINEAEILTKLMQIDPVILISILRLIYKN